MTPIAAGHPWAAPGGSKAQNSLGGFLQHLEWGEVGQGAGSDALGSPISPSPLVWDFVPAAHDDEDAAVNRIA